MPNRIGNRFRQHEREMSAQFCRNTRILWVHGQRGFAFPQFTEFGNNPPQIPAQYKFGSGVRFWQCLAHEISDPDLLVIQQLFDRIESCLGVFIALAIAQQLELKPGRREALQNAVVQVTSEPNPFSRGRSLFSLALQNLPVELHSDPGRDKLDQQQKEITPATTIQNEDPPPAEDSHKRCRPDATNLKSSNEFFVHDRRL